MEQEDLALAHLPACENAAPEQLQAFDCMHHVHNAVACAGLEAGAGMHIVEVGETDHAIIHKQIDASRVDADQGLSSDVIMQHGPIVGIVVEYAIMGLMVQSSSV